MEFLFELLFQLFGELILQLVVQLLAELGIRAASEPFRKAPNPWMAAFGYALFGAVAGGLSLLVFPSLAIRSPFGRLVNLGFTPVVSGIAMAALGWWRHHRDQDLIRMDRFAYGYVFALTMALIRFRFGR
jgi:hypothetical protein